MGRPPDDEERRLFEEEMHGVRPLRRKGDAPLTEEHTDDTVPAAPGTSARPAIPEPEPAPAFEVEINGERVTVFHPSLPSTARRALRRGEMPPEHMLDLHGTGAERAERELRRFVAEALASGRRTLLVITGRGRRSGSIGPVLPSVVLRLLTEPPLAAHVLAAVSAPPNLGGTGALVVLLRRA